MAFARRKYSDCKTSRNATLLFKPSRKTGCVKKKDVKSSKTLVVSKVSTGKERGTLTTKENISDISNKLIVKQQQSVDFSLITKDEVLVPSFRVLEPLVPIRSTRSDDVSEDIRKRHDKLEKEEKAILRRDRIWQNHELQRARLLRKLPAEETLPNVRICVYRKIPNVNRPQFYE